MTTRRNSLITLSAGIAAAAVSRVFGAGAGAGIGAAEEEPLRLRVPASLANQRGRFLRLDGFHLVITNHSKERMGIWRDWCSWGWFCPAISLQLGGASFAFRKAEMFWTVNLPDPHYIDPGDHYVVPVNLFSDDWIQPADFKPARDAEAVITATFTTKPDKDTEKMKIWTGTMQAETKMFLAASV